MLREIKRSCASKPEAKRNDDGTELRIGGYGVVFYDGTEATEYPLWDDAVERISPECEFEFDDVHSMYNHDPNQLLGRESAGTMRLEKDAKGVRYEVDLDPENPVHKMVESNINRGDVDGSSFWFHILSEDMRKEDGKTIWEITKVRVKEMGPVVMPAYKTTTAEARSAHLEARKQQASGNLAQSQADYATAAMWQTLENQG